MNGPKQINLMEVCGTHTMSIAKAGIKRLLPPEVKLLSGPGCPVCVTPPEAIDLCLSLTERPDVTVACYGDMLRVPGSRKGDTLRKRSALGASVKVVYSALDAVELAKQFPDRQIVFLGVGFETTAPGTAASVAAASRDDVKNFSVFSMLKLLEPSMLALAADPEFAIHGFLCPGHVAVITGEKGMRFFPEKLGLPAVISGFEPEEIITSIAMLIRQVKEGRAELENNYRSVVSREGNVLAQQMIREYLCERYDIWRGLGGIERSGLGIRPEYAAFDAEKRFDLHIAESGRKTACRCGDVIRGKLDPSECGLFGTACVPEDPEGPCMVSSEGACAAAYKYRRMF